MNDDTLNRAANANIFLDRMRDSGARVKLSVLDRLLDDAPEMERDRPLSATDALTVLRRAVRRDLEALLNARRRFASVPRRTQNLPIRASALACPIIPRAR